MVEMKKGLLKMINDINFSEEIEKIAAIYLSKIQSNFAEAYMKFEFYSEKRDCGLSTYVKRSDDTIDSPDFETLEMLDLYDIFSAIRKKCIEKWYIAELKFYPDGTWNIEFVYGEIPEVEDEEGW